MADKQISALPEATSVGNDDLFVLEQSQAAKKLSGETLIRELAEELDGHGGIASIEWETEGTAGNGMIHTGTITFTDGETESFYIQDGYKGDQGNQTHVWIKYSSIENPTDNDMSDNPDDYIGVYTGTDNEAPSTASSYTWFKWKGDLGNTGVSIENIQLRGTSGLVDTYRITFSDGGTFDYNVTNGSNIASITKTNVSGLVDTYTVTLTNGNTGGTFSVTNAKSIVSITMISGNHAAGSTDTYQILFNDNDTTTFSVYNGANGAGAVSSVSGIGVSGAGGDVPLILWGNGAPTTATIGQQKQLYYDLSAGIMYICRGENNGSYLWSGMGITVDTALNSSSGNPVANSTLTALFGTASLNTIAQTIIGAINELLSTKQSIASAGLAAYPVGSIYMSVNSTSPADLFGGTWSRIQDTFLLAAGSTYLAGDTGGEATHVLTPSETALKGHTHSYSKPPASTGNGGGHSHNMPLGWDVNQMYSDSTSAGGTVATGAANVWKVTSSSSSMTRRIGASTSSVSAHSHSITAASDSTGNVTETNGSAHNNMPPYLAVYVWQRTA